jgi:hypothetical protein
MWDANENISTPQSKLHDFITKNNLAPIHTILPTACYTRGSTCFDFMMSTPIIREAIAQFGYLSFYDGLWASDHRGLFIDICTDALFHGTPPTIKTAPKKNINRPLLLMPGE